MRRSHSPECVAKNLTAIPDLHRAVLIERWATAYGHPPPKGISRRLLEYAAAYQMQVKTFGGPTPSLRSKLRRAMGSDNRETSGPKSKAITSKIPVPGTRLVREWHGRPYSVEVLESGFLCDGQRYRSLSEVARAITGARWSGPRFFGL